MRARLKAFAGHIWPAGRKLCMPDLNRDLNEQSVTVEQWFSTGVPRHTRVPLRGPRGAAKLVFLVKLMNI
jgi:hypothetical protein